MKKVIYIFDVYYILIIFIYIEICCPICHYMKLCLNHKVILLTDEQSLQIENLTIDSFVKEFNINLEKEKLLKTNIENEILKIDKLYDKIDKEIKEFYLEKHEQLIKEENDLKEKLQNEVTKVKEKLEYFLLKTNNLLKISERINKGIKHLEKEDKNLIKNLSYISKINITQKEMKALFLELMKNININYKENKLNFEIK